MPGSLFFSDSFTDSKTLACLVWAKLLMASARLVVAVLAATELLVFKGILPTWPSLLGYMKTNWVFSSTLLQVYTEDRFRGRVFAADYGLCMLGISASSYFAGVAIDLGVSPRAFAVAIGLVMFVPAAAWAVALRRTRDGRPGKSDV